jgi:hypothetical protein
MEKMILRRVVPPGALVLLLILLPIRAVSGDDPISSPLIMAEVDHAEIGEGFTISVEWQGSGDILLETEYPNTNFTWILTPSANEGAVFDFNLPAPYSRGNISILILYGLDVDDSPPSSTEKTVLPVLGWSDLDMDGLDDSWEERYGVETKDVDHDPDEDGLDLMAEMNNLTHPGKKDSDGDSMDDKWESEKGTLPFRDDPNDDPDRDGWSNVREKNKGTDPRDAFDHPEDPPVTPWYWTLLIVGVLLLILLYFVRQLFSKRRLEDDMEDFDAMSGESKGSDNTGKTDKL